MACGSLLPWCRGCICNWHTFGQDICVVLAPECNSVLRLTDYPLQEMAPVHSSRARSPRCCRASGRYAAGPVTCCIHYELCRRTCQGRSKNASVCRSKNTSVMLQGGPRTGSSPGNQTWVGLSAGELGLVWRERLLL